MISPDFVAPLNAGVLRFDRAREIWRTLVPPHLPAPDQSGSGGNYLTRLTRDPREPDALYLVNQEWVLRVYSKASYLPARCQAGAVVVCLPVRTARCSVSGLAVRL